MIQTRFSSPCYIVWRRGRFWFEFWWGIGWGSVQVGLFGRCISFSSYYSGKK